MASISPAPVIAQVITAKDPGGGFYTVYVRMPQHLISKFPDEAWGTPIEEIGLAAKEVVNFSGHVLVGVETIPRDNSGDLYWVFEKLDGPVWTTEAVGQDGLIPAKFRRQVEITTTRQDVTPDTNPTALTGNLVSSIVQRVEDSGKAVKLDTSETIDESATPLEGQQTGMWGVESTSEQLVEESTATPSGFGTKASFTSPLGNGKSVQQVESYPDPEDPGTPDVVYSLYEEKLDEVTQVPVQLKKSLVNAANAATLAAAERANGWVTEIQALDKWHSILLSSRLDSSILEVVQEWQETQNIRLPDILTEVGVVWDTKAAPDAGSAGTVNDDFIIYKKAAWSVKATASVSASVQGRPYTKILGGYTGPALVNVTRTFVFGPPGDVDESIVPYDFGEVYGTLTIYNGDASASAANTISGDVDDRDESNISGIATAQAQSVSRLQDAQLVIHQFGPVVHSNALTLTETGDAPTVTESVSSTGGSNPSSTIPSATATVEVEGSATLHLPPSGVLLESGDTFLLSVSVSPYLFGYWAITKYEAIVP